MPFAFLLRAPMAGAIVPALALSVACASSQPPAAAQVAPPSPGVTAPDSAPPAAARPDSGVPSWMVVDSAARTVTIALLVRPQPAGGGARINGSANGGLQIVVPLNWTVQWDWRSADSTTPHSLVVMAEREKLPVEGGQPVFSNAMTRMLTAGLPAGQVDRTTFTADQAGWYWMLCGVPSHALGGEYIGLRVDPEAKTASVKTK
jgi:sulfocyanin SoxE-like protein